MAGDLPGVSAGLRAGAGAPSAPRPIEPVALTAVGLACATGLGLAAFARALAANAVALRPTAASRATGRPDGTAGAVPGGAGCGAWASGVGPPPTDAPRAAAGSSAPHAWPADTAASPAHAGTADTASSPPHALRAETGLATWLGDASAAVAAAATAPPPWPGAWDEFDSRATRLAWAGLVADGFDGAVRRAVARHGAHRVALVLGTSASTIGVSERAYREPAADGGFPAALRRPALNHLHAVTAFVQRALGVQGPCATVSTACSSSAKAFAQGERWLRLGLVDAVVVGGVDALSDSLLWGFHALQLVAAAPCSPFGDGPRGISVGEAAGFALLERGAGAGAATVVLAGHGESNDAHHLSSPHPEGLGAERALAAALARAGWAGADAVDHVQLHGTGTAHNDAVEAALVARAYRPDVHAGAVKGCTGHTMGAAGIVGALACVLALREGLGSGTPGTARAAASLPPLFAQRQWRRAPVRRRVRRAALHAFGFGGNNAVLVFEGAGEGGGDGDG